MTQASSTASYVFPDGSSLVRAKGIAWTPWISRGTRFKLLDVDRSFHKMTLLIEADAGATLDDYRHFGAGEYFIEFGSLSCDRGALGTGDYLYEPGGAALRDVRFAAPSQVYALIHGPLRLAAARDGMPEVVDLEWHLARAQANGAGAHIPHDID